MSFEARVRAFADRFLSDRSFELIVAPALADLHYDGGRPGRQTLNRLAVIRAVTGGLCIDLGRDLGSFCQLALVPTSYYLAILVLCADVFPTAQSFMTAVSVALLLSLALVAVCFWPSRPAARPAD
ncbi:MAG: hypothetical protein Q8O42_16900 [Acidobacteriota bacterium]|nr:hypothetical protein [Acidobacteriota bacterium]